MTENIEDLKKRAQVKAAQGEALASRIGLNDGNKEAYLEGAGEALMAASELYGQYADELSQIGKSSEAGIYYKRSESLFKISNNMWKQN